ncbi:MAG: AAA family ATPase [Paracoccus sp. (in: a-proteobacteria)]|uniref:AAA family ATPase n=1 Tax=Paracoccus sp. TaxID=267 RepID=UPI003002110D
MNWMPPDPVFPAFRPLSDPSLLYESAGHRRALAMLVSAVESNQPIAVLTGDVGTGKTLLLRALIHRYRDRIEFGLLGQEGAELTAPLRWALRAFGQDHTDAAPAELLTRLSRFVEACGARGRRVMLIADEAQTLGVEELDQLRQLTDIHGDGRSTMPLLLAGQPGLRARIEHPASLALRSRIGGRFDLPPLSEAETAGYIAHRLSHARKATGADLPGFDPESLVLLHSASAGLPRAIDHLAQQCLFIALRSGRGRIDADILRACIDNDLSDGPARVPSSPEPGKPAGPAPQAGPAQAAPPVATDAALRPVAQPDRDPGPALPVPVPVPPPSRSPFGKKLLAGAAALAGLAAVLAGLVLWDRDPTTTPVAIAPEPAPNIAPVAEAGPDPGPVLARVDAIAAPPDPRMLLNAALEAEAANTAKALMLYERAAIWGSARAAYYLGQYSEAGLGVPIDLQRARAWYGMANGISGAEARLKALTEIPEAQNQTARPVPVMQALFRTGQTELHWRAADGQSPAGFVVEYQLAGGDGTPRRSMTGLPAMLLDRPVARWRLAATDGQGGQGAWTAWIRTAPPPR